MKVDQCQPHENFWTARQSSKVVNWVKTKPRLAGNQIPFGASRFGFVQVSIIGRGYPLLYNLQLESSGGPYRNFHGVGIVPLSKILAVKSTDTEANSEDLKYFEFENCELRN